MAYLPAKGVVWWGDLDSLASNEEAVGVEASANARES